jgi:hypothetical protein
MPSGGDECIRLNGDWVKRGEIWEVVKEGVGIKEQDRRALNIRSSDRKEKLNKPNKLNKLNRLMNKVRCKERGVKGLFKRTAAVIISCGYEKDRLESVLDR